FFNGGALTTARARALYLARRDQIDSAVVAESARWGDAKRATPFERDTHWAAAVNDNLAFINGRAAVLLGQLRSDGVYPGVAAPSFNQHGGAINAGFGLLMAAPAGTVYYTLDGSDPRLPGGALNPAALPYSGLRQLGESTVVKARVRSGGEWSALNEAQFTVIQTFTNLLITELNYHPADSPDLDGDQFEFVELKNAGGRELDLGGVSLTNGVTFIFPLGARLGAGRFAVLVTNAAAFSSRYPGVGVAGAYTGSLANSGERISLAHAVGTPIFSAAYGTEPPWPQAADGGGFSLVAVNPNANLLPDLAASWRASSAPGGSPGADDPPSGLTPVLVNEVLTHTDLPLLDAVELHNPGPVAANIGGWWLSDDLATPKKFRLPAGTVIPAGGYRVFSEADFNPNPNSPTSFTFSSYGDEVWLFSADAAGNLTGYSDGFSFPAAENPVSFGCHLNSAGDITYPPQRQNSLGAVNAGPRVGPVVINEIHYEPPPGGAEFVELKNISAGPVPLFDPAAPTNAWRLGGADFTLPAGLTLPAGGLLVLTAGDPASFRAQHGIPAWVPVLGPFSGVLQNQGERLALLRPDKPDLLSNGWFVPYIEVDAVRYNEKVPWPTNAAGRGASLERRVAASYGDDPANWRDSFGTPSPGLDNDGNRQPTVNAGPDFEATAAVFPAALTLAGTGRDDGLPAGQSLAFRWEQVSGPGFVTFDDPARTNTSARFPGLGTYSLRLTATDGELTRSDELTVTLTRPAAPQRVLPAGSIWRYLDDGSDQGTAWRATAFNDSGWKSGAAQLGYGDGDEATVFGFGPDGADKHPTTYFRRSFSIANRAAVRGLKYGLMRDDGAVVYLNGVEVGRDNMPEGAFNFRTYASAIVGDAEEGQFFERSVDPALLVDGVNVIAVELHQCNATSSDLSFALYLDVDSDPANAAPVVTIAPAGPAQVGVPLALRGSFTDDGLPLPPGVPVLAWSQVSGPASALFSRTNTPATEVTFPAAGTYTLRFSAHDGLITDSETVTITADGGAGGYAVWAAQHFTASELASPAVSGVGADPDGDLLSNRDEYLAGTNPRDPASALELTAQALAAGGTRLRCAGVAGRTYRFQRTDAVGGGWTDVETIGPLAADQAVEVLDGASAAEARFYRVVIP
ncbi:MAG: lamin tail domain-containing protein, partial [Limisphaerales bacterium]